MGLYRDAGVVLRVHALGEADHIVTVLTRQHGRVRAVAKGVRRTRSRFGARLEPFTHVDLQLHTGRSLDTVTQAVTLDAFGAWLGHDYARYTVGTAMLESAERLTGEEREPAPALFALLVSALESLAADRRAPGLLLDAFLLRALAAAGYGMAVRGCARCGAPGPHRALSVATGGVVCPSCRPASAVTPTPETIRLLEALLTGDWASAEGSGVPVRREAAGIVAAHVRWHLEHRVRSLALVERA